MSVAAVVDPKHNVQGNRQAYYDKISKKDMAPLWEVLRNVVTKEPKSKCAPNVWKFDEIKGLMLEASDVISAEEAETHTLKNVILQALGAQNEIYPVSARVAPHKNDVFLLCSDGLSNKVTAASMQRIVLANVDQLEKACVELVREANDNGGEDNITVLLAKFTGDSLPEPVGDDVKLELIDLGGIHDTADQDTAEII